jgi:hypothetical protein
MRAPPSLAARVLRSLPWRLYLHMPVFRRRAGNLFTCSIHAHVHLSCTFQSVHDYSLAYIER